MFNSFWIGSVLVVVLTGLYTVVGGMRAVAYTEAVQTLILVVGSLLLTDVRPDRSLAAGASCAPCSTRNVQPLEAADSTRASRAPGRRCRETGRMAWYFNTNYPWPGMLLCAPIIGLWYWCTDQYIVQRTLGAPERARGAPRQHLRRIPQAAAGVHLHHPGHDRGGACADGRRAVDSPLMVDADGNAVPAAAQAAFPLMVQHVMPVGLRGLVVAGLLAALMSSLAGVFNACVDALHDRLLPEASTRDASQAQLVWIGRVATTVMVIVGAAVDSRDPGRARAYTNTCRACRAISHRRSSRCSSSACS